MNQGFIKFFSIVLTLVLATTVFAVPALAEHIDTEIDMSDAEIPANVSLEAKTDAGYIKQSGNNYTAVAYEGNEFLGWFKEGESTPYSTNTTEKLTDGDFVAKFKDNNILSNAAGYELLSSGTNLKDSTWFTNKGTSWVWATATKEYAKSGTKALALYARNQNDIYTTISGLESNTYYVVSYYWMLPQTVVTDTPTAGDGYYGSVIGTTDCASTDAAKKLIMGGDISEDKKVDFTGGQWNKSEFVFNSANYSDLRLFFYYYSNLDTGNDFLYVDELTVYKAPDQQAAATYKPTVTAENGYAFSMLTEPVKYDTEVSVVAAPFGGYTFDGWYEDGVKVSEDRIYTFNIQSNRNLTAKCVPTITPYAPDMDNNGAINLKDLIVLAQHVANWKVTINNSVVDVNGSGLADLTDVTLLAQYLAGWDVKDNMVADKAELPEENLKDAALADTLLSGNSEYYNKSTVVNEGNKALLAKVFKKAQAGNDITIVGFGGSITEGAKASSTDNRYGERVAAWFRAQFPNITVTYVNSGIGSTPSLVGVHRMKEDVLDHNPDLVLVDFTTNDNAGALSHRSSYETILRTLIKENIAVISIAFGAVSNYNANNTAGSNVCANNCMSIHLPSVLYYDVPYIDYYGSLWRYINAGIIKWTDVAGDYIHPNDAGHLMTASAITNYLSDVLAKVDLIDTTDPVIPNEYFFGDDIFETATFLNSDNFEPTKNTNFVAGTVHNKAPKGWLCTSTTGGSITFEIKGMRSICIFLQQKSGNGKGSVVINGVTFVSNTDCDNSSTNGYMWISAQTKYDVPTDVTITVTCDGIFGLGPIGVAY